MNFIQHFEPHHHKGAWRIIHRKDQPPVYIEVNWLTPKKGNITNK